MRILLDAQTLSQRWSGIGYYLAELASALSARPEVQQVGLAAGLRIRTLAELASPADRKQRIWKRVLTRAAGHFGRPLVHAARSALLRRSRHAWSVFHGANFVSPQTGLPLVTTVHDLGFLRYPEFMPADRVRWIQSRIGRCLQRSQAILVISDFVRRELLECYPSVPPEKIFVTPLGVDHGMFNSSVIASAANGVTAKYRLPRRFLLYVGTLEPRKNVQGMVEGYLRLPVEARKEFPLVLAGAKGWRLKPLEDAMARLRDEGTLHYVGYVPRSDVVPLMQLATAFLFPSHYEGFGLPPLEAAACGTPVLCSHVASLPEVMGDAAVYVEPTSADDIADGLHRLLSSDQLRQVLRQRGLNQAAKFHWDKCATATIAAYRAAA